MTLSPEAQHRADEIAAAAPPLTAEQRHQIRLILWGSTTPSASAEASPAESSSEAA
jgi:hypothetical protein